MESTQLVILAGLAIGLIYGAVGLLSGFCLMSSMRGFLAKGDSRLVRTYALAIAVAIFASQFLAGNGMVGLGEAVARVLAAAAVAVALALFALSHRAFRRSPGQIAAGVIVGLLVAGGWFVTGYLGADDFNPVPVTSLTFIAPIADALQYAMLSTGLTLNFGIATVAGVFAGSLLTALATGRFQFEGYSSPRHMLRSAGGAALMGAGGAMAYGCSVGQGLTGLSSLALASFVAVAGILLGTAAGLRGALRVQPLVAETAR